MKKKILLITSPRPKPGDSPLHFGDNRPPQGLGYLAAYLKQNGHEVEIIDLYAFGGEIFHNNPFVNQEEIGKQLHIDILENIASFRPDFIGMYIHTMSFETACDLSRELKQFYPDLVQICGGPHPTIMPESMPDTFDYIVIGEGEYALLDIVEGYTSDRIIYGNHLRSKDLDKLPWPDFDLFWGKPYNWGLKLYEKDIWPVFTISTSRGCPFRCRFCGIKYVYPFFKGISERRIFDRMIQLAKRYGVETFYFREDCFTADLRRLEAFCSLIIEKGINFKWVCESRVKELSPRLIRKMRRAGCLGLYIGCESGSPRVLKNMRKDETREDFIEKFPILHEHGINTYTTWVYGTPDEHAADRRLTDELITMIQPTTVDRFVYIGIPKSDYYNQFLENREYEFIDKCGFLYPNGYLSLATQLYGKEDPRVQYVRRIYSQNSIANVDIQW